MRAGVHNGHDGQAAPGVAERLHPVDYTLVLEPGDRHPSTQVGIVTGHGRRLKLPTVPPLLRELLRPRRGTLVIILAAMLVQMTATGEETGKLDTMLMRTADFYEQRVTAAVEGLSSLVEPIAIVILGGMVGLMLIALYLPIFSLGQAMRQGLLGH